MQLTTLSLTHLQFLAVAALWTIALSLIAFVGGGLGGALIALGRTSSRRWLRMLSGLYVQVLQGVPLLITMFMAYFGLAVLGLELPAIVAAGLSITAYAAAYLGEIWCGALEAVPRTQREASESLGLGYAQTLCLVVVPQAVRIATPPTVGFLVQIIKNTSLASIIGFAELSYVGKLINNSTFQPFLVYLIVAGIYFCLCYPISVWSRSLERHANVHHR